MRLLILPFLPLLLLTSPSLPAAPEPEPQPQMLITPASQGTMNLDWDGIPGRTYFMQFSMNLMDWHYAPFIDFGDDGHHRGMQSDASRMFFRLIFADIPGIHSLEDAMNADFSGDGLSNIFKVTHGYDPFNQESTSEGPDALLDPDGDGLSNASEQTLGRDPMRKDHPAVQLLVTIE